MQFGSKKLFSLFFAFFLAWAAVRFLLPLFSPFLFGTALALAAEPLVRLLSGRFRLPRTAATGIGVTMTFGFGCALLLVLCAFALQELKRLTGYLPQITVTLQNSLAIVRGWLLSLCQQTPQTVRPLLQEHVQSFFSSGTALLDQTVRSILGFAGNLLSHIPDSALTVGTAILSAFMISVKLPFLHQALLSRISRERREKLAAAGRRMGRAASGWFRAQVKLMAVTFVILLAGFWILRLGKPLLLALVISAVDAFPVLGTGTVLIPWSFLCLLQGKHAYAVGLLGIYVTVSLVRSMLEPKLIGRHLGLDPLVTLMALYAGFQLWGIGGMLLAPLLTVTAVQILPDRSQG